MDNIVERHLPQMKDFLDGSVKSLGWGVLNWCSVYLGQPDGDSKGDSWEFSPEQGLFILRHYAVDDNGQFLFYRSILERPKGWGKSPLLAALCCVELLGPVRFSHWDRGFPVGKRQGTPLIQIAAISEDQANNTYDLVMEMLKGGLAYREYELQGCVMYSKVQTHDGGLIQKVTASPKGREGQRVTFVVCDETHLWVPTEKGPELMGAISRNATKMDNRIVETTNAPVPGQESVAESSYNAVMQMIRDLEAQGYTRKPPRILLDSREVFIEDIYDRDQAFPALRYVYGDSVKEAGGWLNLERIFEGVTDPSTTEHDARRFYFNQKLNQHSGWLKPSVWADAYDGDIKLKKTDKIALGFKVVPRNGAAVIVACRLSDGALFNLSGKHWERTEDDPADWEVPHTEIEARIKNLVEKYDVWKILADPQSYQDIIGRWSKEFGENPADKPMVEEFWTQQNKTKMSRAVEQFEEAVVSKRLSWRDPQINQHVLNCHTEEVPGGFVLRKENKHSKRYIVAALAAVLALEASVLAIEEGAMDESQDGELYRF